jgi:hypothetical protein
MMNKLLLSLTAIFFGAVACSVKQGEVPSNPPVLNGALKVSVLSHFGTLRADSISVFLWPKDWTEAQMETNVEKINRDAQKIEPLQRQVIAADQTIQNKWKQFKDIDKCIEKFVDKTKFPDPDFIQESDAISDWLPVADADKPALLNCQKNQDERAALRPILTTKKDEQIPFITDINSLLDPNPDAVSNSVSITPQGSQISIKQKTRPGTHETVVSVDVTLTDFLRQQNTQSTEKGTVGEASYGEAEGLLSFTVPELNPDGTPTGQIYSFNLYRGENYYADASTGIEYACFKGTVDLMKNGVSVRNGKAQIAGFLNH